MPLPEAKKVLLAPALSRNKRSPAKVEGSAAEPTVANMVDIGETAKMLFIAPHMTANEPCNQ